MTDKQDMFLALAIKQAGGQITITKDSFMEMDDNFEIMASRNMEGNVVLSLVEGDLVAQLRKARAIEDAKKGLIHGES